VIVLFRGNVMRITLANLTNQITGLFEPAATVTAGLYGPNNDAVLGLTGISLAYDGHGTGTYVANVLVPALTPAAENYKLVIVASVNNTQVYRQGPLAAVRERI
jgi:hypothetical protein